MQKANQQILKQSEHLEVEVEERTKDLAQAKENAESANKAKSVFLSSMSHELRTPLNAINGFAQVLKNDVISPLNEDQKESVDEILNGSEHLLTLINEILNLAKIEAGEQDCVLNSTVIKELLDECLTMVQNQTGDKGIKIEVADDFSISCMADSMKTKQVILNLLTNAIKYNKPSGHIYIEGEKTSDGYFRLLVRDTGLGIPEEKQALIFEAFSRLGMETTEIEGTGIGLVVTKELVELMGGRIGFNSEYRIGSTFWFELALVELN